MNNERRERRQERKDDPERQRLRKERWRTAGRIIGNVLLVVPRIFGIRIPLIEGSIKNQNHIFLNENNTGMKSAFGKLNGADFWKSLLVAVLTVVVAGVSNAIADGQLPTVAELQAIGTAALSAAGAYLLKNFFTTSDDKFFGVK